MGRCCAASIAASWASGRQGEGESRGWDYFMGAPGSMAREGFAMGWRLGIKLNFDAVCGRRKNAVDRWFNHLLIFILVLVLLLQQLLEYT